MNNIVRGEITVWLFDKLFGRREEFKVYKYNGGWPDNYTTAMCSRCGIEHTLKNKEWEVLSRGDEISIACVFTDENYMPTLPTREE